MDLELTHVKRLFNLILQAELGGTSGEADVPNSLDDTFNIEDIDMYQFP